MSEPLPNPEITKVVEKITEVVKQEKTDASKILFYLGVGVIIVGGFILYKKAQETKKLDAGT